MPCSYISCNRNLPNKILFKPKVNGLKIKHLLLEKTLNIVASEFKMVNDNKNGILLKNWTATETGQACSMLINGAKVNVSK